MKTCAKCKKEFTEGQTVSGLIETGGEPIEMAFEVCAECYKTFKVGTKFGFSIGCSNEQS